MKTEMTPHRPDQAAYRRSLGGFATGVVLAAAPDADGNTHGIVINSFTSVSLEPRIVLWCLGLQSAALEVFTRADRFSLNVLEGEDEALARRYSRSGDRLIPEGMLTRLSTGGAVLTRALTALDCRMHDRRTVGDHEVIFGEVDAFTHRDAADGLGYFRGRYTRFPSGV
ncbi:flavin reductase [bacterium]|nr:flavin reductase [bacterium]